MQQWLKEYTVFTLVRNPYTRAASGWSFLNHVVRAGFAGDKVLEKKPWCSVDWGDFCFNPRVLVQHCLEFPECCGAMKMHGLMHHTDPQSPCIMGEDGTWAVDFIARAEHSEEDVLDLVDLINERRPKGVEALPKYELEHPNVQSCDPTGMTVTKNP